VHRSRDLAAQVLLRTQHETRDRSRHRRVGIGREVGVRRRCISGRELHRRIQATHRPQVLHEPVPVAGQRASLPVEHVDLRLHQRRSLGQRDEAGGLIEALLRVAFGRERRELLGCRCPAPLVAGRLAPGLGEELVDLGQLAIEPDEIVGEPA
jgi:hypothetical protein